jgi:mono/diheme cytochrome c family protein
MSMLIRSALTLVLVSLGIFYWVTKPTLLAANVLKPRHADLSNGETLFNVGGCASCHATPGQPDRLKLGGGRALKTAFGIFIVPNISSDKTVGIGGWRKLEFVNAMLRGVGRSGEHLYPAFPYPSYQRLSVDDVLDLFAFMRTVPADGTPSQPHALDFPFNIRRAIGLWKFLFLDRKPFQPDPARSTELNRGAFLVEGPAHCAECHSPRNVLGAIKSSRRFAGGLNPAGKGFVPNITQHADGLAGWSQDDMNYFLKEGLTPDGQSVDSEMKAVIDNTARLSAADRTAMAAYLKSLPARPGRPPPPKTAEDKKD